MTLHKPSEKLTPAERLRARFPIGCRVVPSQHAVDINRFPVHRKRGIKVEGTVTGYIQNNSNGIMVLVDGRKRATEWHILFWDRVIV